MKIAIKCVCDACTQPGRWHADLIVPGVASDGTALEGVAALAPAPGFIVCDQCRHEIAIADVARCIPQQARDIASRCALEEHGIALDFAGATVSWWFCETHANAFDGAGTVAPGMMEGSPRLH